MEALKLFTLAPQAVTLDNGQTVYVKRMTVADKLNHDTLTAETPEALFDYLARLLVFTLCDKDGNRLFSDTDVELIKQFDSRMFEAVTSVALEVNALTKSAQDDAKKK